MTELFLNSENISSRGSLHDLFAEKLSLPEWYGRNLDALHDCLTEQNSDIQISVAEEELIAILGDRYVEQLLRMLRDTAEENPHIILV